MEISIPYGLEEKELMLDDAARGAKLLEELRWLVNDELHKDQFPSYDQEGGMVRIFTATACLIHAHAGTVAECLRTAVIWERG